MVQAQAVNQYGAGESYTYYIIKYDYSGYRMVYPNPTNDKLTIEFDYAEIADFLLKDIVLYNEKANEVKRYDLQEAKANKRFLKSKNIDMDVSNLEKGIYYLHIFVADKVHKERIIIQ